MKRRPRVAALLGVCVAAFTGPLLARDAAPAKSSSLLGELGTPAAERLLASDAAADRLRGFARLSALGSTRAVELLSRALDPGGAARGAEEHLAAVRALAPYVKVPAARDALVRALSSPPVEADAAPLSDWVRSSAALALARSREPSALSALGRALRKPGHAAELAKQALIENPPQDLSPMLHAPGTPTKELCEALGALGDLRAEGFLREIVRRGAPEARAAAALALLRLGSTEVVELSRHWLRTERQPVLLAAAAEILTRSAHADARGALEKLAESDATRGLSLDLLLLSDGRIPAPASLDATLAADRSASLFEIFARGSGWGAARLERALASPDSAGLALYALSRTPTAAAFERLKAALHSPSLRSLALRALALRYVRLGGDAALIEAQAAQLLQSKVGSERAAAALAQSLVNPERLPQLLASADLIVVRAVARLALSGDAARVAAKRLVSERDAVTRTALSIALVEPSAAALVPTPTLLELTHDAGPGSLLASAALSARKDQELLPLIRELLTSPDPWLRAHTLLGLSRARESDVLGLIETAYRFEPDESVRHAAIVALSRRSEPVKARTLRLAAELDGARAVREAAKLALAGHALGDGALGVDSIWVELTRTAGLEPSAVPAAQVRVGFGLALPVVADPDGVVALGGVDPADLSVRLALLDERVFVPGAGP
jgi:cellulose synthase operon protein C